MLAKGQERVLCVCVAKVWSKTHGFVLGFEDLQFFFSFEYSFAYQTFAASTGMFILILEK